jgi:hypothetical protein
MDGGIDRYFSQTLGYGVGKAGYREPTTALEDFAI